MADRRRRRRLFGRFSPLAFPGLQLWLDASQITGLADADPVGTWPDLSGNGNDATQATEANKPLYKVNILNGRPVVRFDGVNDSLDSASDPVIDLDGNFSLLIVAKPDDTATNKAILGKHPTTATAGEALYFIDLNEKPVLDRPFIEAGIAGTDAISTTAFSVISCLVSGTGAGGVAHFLNGTANGTDTLTTGTAGTTPFAVGRARHNTLFMYDGDIAEVIVYNRALSAAERKRVEQYLGSKYGISVA